MNTLVLFKELYFIYFYIGYITHITSISGQLDIYADDLVHFLDAAHEENCKILQLHELSDCLI